MTDSNMKHEGHRERLRLRFLSSPDSLKESELLELLLTFAIPRRDVEPLAAALIGEFGSLDAVLSLSPETLQGVAGIGDSTVTLIQLIQTFAMHRKQTNQPSLFETANQGPIFSPKKRQPAERKMRIFANDEVANSLEFLPRACDFQTLEEFRLFLCERLPYNSAETRLRRASYFIDRYYPQGVLDTPLTYFLSKYTSSDSLKAVIFYHVLKSEPIASLVANDLIYPALPIGKIEREQLREFTLNVLPNTSDSSMNNMLRSFFITYNLLGIGSSAGETVRINLRQGSLDAFIYIFTCEYPQPDIYSFDQLFQGPVHRWLLWDKEWIRRQLYNLRDFGILSKISEIDSMRQFTLAMDQSTALHVYFENAGAGPAELRDRAEDLTP